MGGGLWCYWFYHLYYELDHLTGEFPFYDGSEWSDEHLGIPPDEEGLAPTLEYGTVRTTRIAGCNPQLHNFPPYLLDRFHGDTGPFKF